MVDQRMKARGGLELSGQEFSTCQGVFYSLSLLIAPTPGEARINVLILQTRKLRHTVLNLTKSTRELWGWHLDLSLGVTQKPSPGPQLASGGVQPG